MRYHNITKDDMLNGDGLRVVLWVAGCSHCCKECQNPVTWDPAGGLLFDDAAKQEIFDQLDKSYISGITFSGGDPLHAANRLDVRNLMAEIKEKYPDLPIDGELQFDAAVSPRVARTKCPDSNVAGHANTFIFPDINAGNIGYKIAQRMGNFEAYGPILLGLNAPVNDLSRGCNASEVYSMAIITAALANNI